MDAKLKLLETEVSNLADQVEAMVRAAYRGLRERCLGTADKVLEMEAVINDAEVEIENHCLAILALQQPVAIDLRRVAGALKINADLERIADLSLNLAERTEDLALHSDVEIPMGLADMVTCAMGMLRDAKSAFINSDADLARAVCRRDDELDGLNRDLIKQLVKLMEANSDKVAGYLHVFSAVRIVERIGDHATNIAEDVEYIVDGDITRHRSTSPI